MELGGREMRGPRPIPSVRTPLEMEAGLLDSGVQELLGTEELSWLGDESMSGPQLQWTTQTEFAGVVRLFELNCCAIPLTAAGSGGILCSACNGGCCSGLRNAARRCRRAPHRWTVRSCTSFRFFRAGIHRDCYRPRGTGGNCLRSARGICPILTRRTATTFSVIGRNAAWDERCSGVDEGCVLASRQWRRRGVRRRERNFHHQAGSRSLLRSVSAKPNSRQQFPLMWKISLACWPHSKSVELLPSRRTAVRALRCWGLLLLREIQAAQHCEVRTLLGAGAGISRIRLRVKSTRVVPPEGDVPPHQLLDLAEVACKAGSSSGQAQKLTLTRRKSSEERVWQQWKRSTPRFSTVAGQEGAPATGRQCPGAAHSTHPSRMLWGYHYAVRDESAGRSDDSSP